MSWQSSLTNDESMTWVALLVMWFISYSKLCSLARSRISCSVKPVYLLIKAIDAAFFPREELEEKISYDSYAERPSQDWASKSYRRIFFIFCLQIHF